jgi:signal peptidase II
MTRSHWRILPPLVAVLVFLADWSTKQAALAHLVPHVPYCVAGDFVCLTLAFNPGAAMGTSLGAYSRWGFTTLALAAVIVCLRLYLLTPPPDLWRRLALALIIGGALGNALDRILSSAGVVDFIDVGINATRFWTFNVADSAVVTGAALLSLAMLKKTPTTTG